MRKIVSESALTLLGIAACISMSTPASADESRQGVATGRAVACSGPALDPVAHLNVYKGKTLVRSTSLPQGSTFRFILKPGTYVISNEGHPGRYVGSAPFKVLAGRSTHVTVRDFCM